MAAGLGGGIFSNGGSVTLVNDTFTANTASGGAGGTATGNASAGGAGEGIGGAVFVLNGELNATFVTFSGDTVTNGDSSAGTASELYVLGDGNGTAYATTLVNDILGQSGDSTVTDFGTSAINDGTMPDFTESTNDLVTNDPTDGSGLPSDCVIATGDPMLGPLASNGGPTQTMALYSSSSAIGAGVAADFPGTETPITTDQTGATLNSPPDLGAIQYASATPTVTISTGTLDLGTTTAGTAGSAESYIVSGTGLTADILITAPTGVELSDDGGTTWSTSLDLTESDGTIDTTTIDARIAASADVGEISGSIANTSSGTTEQDVTVSGTVNAIPTIAISTGTLDLGTTTTGTAGSTESYTISGTGLTADILITAATGVELSDDGGTTWSTGLDLTETGGTVNTTTIDARIGAIGRHRGDQRQHRQHQRGSYRAGRERQRQGRFGHDELCRHRRRRHCRQRLRRHPPLRHRSGAGGQRERHDHLRPLAGRLDHHADGRRRRRGPGLRPDRLRHRRLRRDDHDRRLGGAGSGPRVATAPGGSSR